MASAHMLERCPDAKLLDKVYIKDWELRFHFFADIEPRVGANTPAIVWEISESDEQELDRYEGFPKHYRKENIIVELNGKPVSTMAYVMTDWKKTQDPRANDNPDEKYVGIIKQGYREAGFSESIAL